MAEALRALCVALAATLLAVAVWWGWSVWGESDLVLDAGRPVSSDVAAE